MYGLKESYAFQYYGKPWAELTDDEQARLLDYMDDDRE